MADKINCFVALTPENYKEFQKALSIAGPLLEEAMENELVEKPEIRISSAYNGISVELACKVPYDKEKDN